MRAWHRWIIVLSLILGAQAFHSTLKNTGSGVIRSEYSREEMEQFARAHVTETLKTILAANHPIPEIRELFVRQADKIVERHGDLRTKTFGSLFEDPLTALGTDYSTTPPRILISLPGLMNIWREFKGPEQNRIFEVYLTLAYMHELEHLAGRELPAPSRTRQDHVIEESRAWDKTCGEVFSIFINYSLPLDSSHHFYYEGWERCGKQNNGCWKSFIEEAYYGSP